LPTFLKIKKRLENKKNVKNVKSQNIFKKVKTFFTSMFKTRHISSSQPKQKHMKTAHSLQFAAATQKN